MLNSKGLTLVELLATITIIGILSGAITVAYNTYQKKAINQSYETMIKSAGEAAEEYFMDHNNTTEVTLKTLAEEKYISNIDDPADKNNHKGCTGTVIKEDTTRDSNSIEDVKYEITINCTNYKDCRKYPSADEKGKMLKCNS